MPDSTSNSHRRTAVDAPGSIFGYDRLMIALAGDDPVQAIRAARCACVIDPASRRARQNLMILLRDAGRWDELRAAIPRQSRRLPPRRSHPVDLDAGVARYGRLLDAMTSRTTEGWTPSRVEDSKHRFPLDQSRLSLFRRSEVSSGTQTIPDRPPGFPALDFERLYPDYTTSERHQAADLLQQQYLGLLARLYRTATPAIDFYDALVVDDDRFGGRTVDLPGLGPVTAKSLQSAYYACRIAPMLPRGGVMLEIGGGFGALAARLLALRPDVTCVLTDLPVNMVLTHTYLTSLYGDAVTGLWEDGDLPGAGHRALVVPPWRLPGLPLRADLAVNTMSFQHMDERNHAFYGDAMKALGTKWLFHVNRNEHINDPATDTMIVTAERYSFMADYEVVDRRDFDRKWIEIVARAR